jgi:glycerol-3-phosphate acyltransferase PlsY
MAYLITVIAYLLGSIPTAVKTPLTTPQIRV